MSTHWGEIPTATDADSGIAALEREQMTKLRPMDVEGPALYQPSSGDSTHTSQPHPAEAFALDSVTLHTIRLVQYARKVRQLIQSVQQQLETTRSSDVDKEKEMPLFSEAPPIPEFPGKDKKHQPPKLLPYTPKDLDSPFVTGCGTSPPEIDSRNCRKLLRRAVSAICAHTGYDNCPEGILETLTDLTSEYFLQMTTLLRRAVDNEAVTGGTGFPDAVQQVFHEMGVGDPHVLHDFYQTRILRYHRNMTTTCQQLVEEYERVRNPDTRVMLDVKNVMRTPKDAGSMSDIQFPTLEEDDGADTEHVIHLEGLGLDINIVNEPAASLSTDDDGGKWGPGGAKAEIDKTQLDQYDPDDSSAGGDTPVIVGEDPASVSDIMSPPSIGLRTGEPPRKKKK